MSLYGGINLPGKPDLENVRKLDLLPQRAIAEMMHVGMAVDREWFSQLSAQLTTEIKELKSKICSYIPADKLDEFIARANQVDEETGDDIAMNVGSTQQLSKLLFEVLGIGAGRSLKMTKSGDQISTGKKQLEKFKREHPVVPLVLECKEKSKIKNTYSDKLPLMARLHKAGSCWCGDRHWYDSHRIHTSILSTRTSTGRLACVAKWTPVRVQGGIKRIDEIKIGDLVWTHKGRWRPVTATWVKGFDQMYHIIFSNGNVLTCTGYHRLLIYSDEHIKAMVSQSEKRTNSLETISVNRMPHDPASGGSDGNDLWKHSVGMQESDTSGRIQGAIQDSVLPFQTGREEPNVRQDRGTASQLDWSGRRWVRVSDLLEGWQETVCTSDCDGRSIRIEGTTRSIRRASYRRGYKAQRTRQSRSSYNQGAQSNSHKNEGFFGVYIEEIHTAGSLEVYDITVDEDESYAACGVFSHNSKNPNLQNIPARTELGQRTRRGFIPSCGMGMNATDFGQFEMRLGTHYSMDENLLRIFHNDLDPHSDTACRAFMKTLDEVDHGIGRTLYRAPCKNVNFGIFYGLTPDGLYDLMLLTYATAGLDIPDWLTLEWCAKFIDDWFELYPGVRNYMEAQFYRAQRYGIVWTLLGRVRRIPEVRSVHQRIVQGGLRQAGNAPIQGTQADLNKIAIAEVYNEVVLPMRAQGIACSMLMTVHDEIVNECEEEYNDLMVTLNEDVMSRVMVDRQTGIDQCLVPIKAEGHTMARWEK